jgi:hypothetical protein
MIGPIGAIEPIEDKTLYDDFKDKYKAFREILFLTPLKITPPN